jgi:anthranilate synthase component II
MKLLIIDNYDSFTFNLVQIIEEFEVCNFSVVKNDKILLKEVEDYDKILFSPGPGVPSETYSMRSILEKYHRTKSILGICLGHQAIAEFFGAGLYNMDDVYHGIKQKIFITDKYDYLFQHLPGEIYAGLYHSWAVSDKNFPRCLKVTAISPDKIIMAFSHLQYDIKGVQFHPESIMTEYGSRIILNWLKQ